MPRPKGSKNKAKAAAPVVNYDEIIPALEAEIATLTERLKAKKAELKAAQKAKAEADAAAAAKKAEEDKAKLLEAIAASGKTVEEVLEMLQ